MNRKIEDLSGLAMISGPCLTKAPSDHVVWRTTAADLLALDFTFPDLLPVCIQELPREAVIVTIAKLEVRILDFEFLTAERFCFDGKLSMVGTWPLAVLPGDPVDIAIVILMLHAVVDIRGSLNSVAAGEHECKSSNELHVCRVVDREGSCRL